MIREDCGRHLCDVLLSDGPLCDGRRKRHRQSWEELRTISAARPNAQFCLFCYRRLIRRNRRIKIPEGCLFCAADLESRLFCQCRTMPNNAEPFRVNRLTPSDLINFRDQLLRSTGRTTSARRWWSRSRRCSTPCLMLCLITGFTLCLPHVAASGCPENRDSHSQSDQ